jgi:hypothetical protein
MNIEDDQARATVDRDGEALARSCDAFRAQIVVGAELFHQLGTQVRIVVDDENCDLSERHARFTHTTVTQTRRLTQGENLHKGSS